MKKLQNKISVRFFILILVTMTVTYISTIYLTSRQFHKTLLERLDDSSRGIEIEIENIRQDLFLRTKAISENENITRAVNDNDRHTLLYLLGDVKNAIGADIVTAIDSNGIVMARAHSPAEYGDDISGDEIFQKVKRGEYHIDIGRGISGIELEISVPVMMKDKIIGELHIGKLVDYGFIKRLKDEYGLDIIVADKTRLQATTFTNPRIIGDPDLRNLSSQIQTHKDSITREICLADEEYYVVGKPILSNNKQMVGEYFLAISQKPIHRTMRMLNILFLLVTALLLLVCLFVSHRISVKIGKPLTILSMAALEAAKGDLSIKVEVTSDDEVGILAESFNTMTDNLSKTTTSIQNLEAEIQKRKKAEEEIKQAKEQYETLVSNMPEAIYSALADEKGTSMFMSARWGQWTGYDTNDPEIWQKSVHPDDRERTIKVYLEAAKEKKDYIIDYRLVHKDSGQVHWVWDHSSPIIDEKGNVVRFDGIVADITDRKQAEEERDRLLKTIQIINENLQSIVYVASHDLRSPLVNIEGFSGELGETCLQLKQMLDDSSIDDDLKQKLLMLLDEDITESIKFITAGASKMALLLEGLLQVSRIGTTTVEIKPVDMDKLMNDIHQAMEFQVKKAGVELIVEHVPDCFGDKAMTNQIFSNILGNALKYLDPKRQGRIHISGRTENEMSVYCVEDNGIGIDPSHQKRIFEIFQRLNPDDDAGGEGLGLAIVVRILDRQNGHIWLESEPGKGSKFYVSLPGI